MSETNDGPEIGTDAYDQRIRERAYRLWEQDGCPEGQDLEFWERARELVGMESNPHAGQIPNPVPPGADRPLEAPPVDEAILEENLGEVPGRLTDQGDRPQAPVVPRKKRQSTARNTRSSPTT
jgi:hypothetical protein